MSQSLHHPNLKVLQTTVLLGVPIIIMKRCCCLHQSYSKGPAASRSCTSPNMHQSCPAASRSYTSPNMHQSCPAASRSCTSPNMHQSCPAASRFCTQPQYASVLSCCLQILHITSICISPNLKVLHSTSILALTQRELHVYINPDLKVLQPPVPTQPPTKSETLTLLATSPNEHFVKKFRLVNIKMYRNFRQPGFIFYNSGACIGLVLNVTESQHIIALYLQIPYKSNFQPKPNHANNSKFCNIYLTNWSLLKALQLKVM